MSARTDGWTVEWPAVRGASGERDAHAVLMHQTRVHFVARKPAGVKLVDAAMPV